MRKKWRKRTHKPGDSKSHVLPHEESVDHYLLCRIFQRRCSDQLSVGRQGVGWRTGGQFCRFAQFWAFGVEGNRSECHYSKPSGSRHSVSGNWFSKPCTSTERKVLLSSHWHLLSVEGRKTCNEKMWKLWIGENRCNKGKPITAFLFLDFHDSKEQCEAQPFVILASTKTFWVDFSHSTTDQVSSYFGTKWKHKGSQRRSGICMNCVFRMSAQES